MRIKSTKILLEKMPVKSEEQAREAVLNCGADPKPRKGNRRKKEC